MDIWQKLEGIENKFVELEKLLADSEVLKDTEKYRQYAKEHADLSKIVQVYREYKKLQKELEENKELLLDKDEELRNLAKAEISTLNKKIAEKKKTGT